MFTADALIRAVLHINPDELEDEEWIHQVRMAEWALQITSAGKLG